MTMKLATAGEATAMTTDVSDRSGFDQAGPDRHTEELTRIGEMAKAYGVTLRTLRFYEDKGLLNPLRDGAIRLYTRRDRARLKLILLGRKVGFSLREVKQIIDLYDPTGTNVRQLKVALDKSEKQLARLQKQRALIDDAIDEIGVLMATVRGLLADRAPGQPTN
jgi:DNA-binding transcriptional MerR regulator